MEKNKGLFQKYKEIIMYLIFGVATTLIRWVTQFVFIKLFNLFLPQEEIKVLFLTYKSTAVFVATILSWLLAVIFAYVTNKLWVFESKSWSPDIAVKEFCQFFLSRVLTGVIEIVGVFFLVGIGMNEIFIPVDTMDATVLMSGIIMVLNYIASKLIVFKEGNPKTIVKEEPEKTEE